MSQELIYTSAPRGLKPGTRGFCTVVSTQQMSQPLAERLESLSGYRHLFAHHDAQAGLNPVIHSHLILAIGGRKYHVLSRIADAGLDYTQRSNKFVHHVVLDATELPAGGPAWLVSQPGFMQTEWDSEPKVLASGRRPPAGFDSPAVCRYWQQLTGDAGWAGVLAETASGPVPRAACIFFRPGQHLLPLVAEALSLLPQSQRWNVTFSTWFTKLPPGVDCQWRFLLADSPEAKQARRQPHALLIDLTEMLPEAEAGALVQAARTGILTAAMQPVAPPALVRSPGPAPQEGGMPIVQSPPQLSHGTEYGLGPPFVAGPHPPTFRPTTPGKRRSTNQRAFVAAMIGMICLFIGAVIGIRSLLTANNGSGTLAGSMAGIKKTSREATPTETVAAGMPPTTIATQDALANSDDKASPEGPTKDGATQPKTSSPTDDDGVDDESTTRTAGPNSTVDETAAQPDQPQRAAATGSATNPAVSPATAVTKQADSGRPAFLELPLQDGTSANARSEPVKLLTVDPRLCELSILGCQAFFEDEVTIDKSPDGNVSWQVGHKTQNAIGGAAKLGQFSLRGDELFFQWQGSDTRLRNCLLTLKVGGENEAVYFLRRPMPLPPTALGFEHPSNTIEIPLQEPADTIKQDLLRLRVEADGIAGASVTPSEPVPVAKGVALAIPFRPNDGANQQVKRDVEVRIHLRMTGGRLQLLLENFGQQAELRLDTGKWEVKRQPLSFRNVDAWKEATDVKLTTLNKRRNEVEEDLKAIPPPPSDPKANDPRKKERDEAIARKSEVTKRIEECSQESLRCEELTALLKGLHATIRVTVFYPVDKFEVVLSETRRD